MQRRHDGDAALAGLAPQELQHLQLRANVQVRGGLVEQQHARFLAKRAGEKDALPLAVADVGEVALGELGGARGLQRGADGLVVLLAQHPEPPGERVASGLHHVAAGEELCARPAREHDRHLLRTLRGRHLGERAAEELDDAAERAQLARHGAQYRGLAGAVGADERHDLTRPHRQADVAHESPLPVPHRQLPQLQRVSVNWGLSPINRVSSQGGHRDLPRSMRAITIGAPKTAVTALTESSTGEKSVRATRSHPQQKVAPVSRHAGVT